MTDHRLPDRSFAAFLFDMDGTIVNSIAAANRIWTRWAERHGLDAAAIIDVLHGVQVAATVRRFATEGMDVAHEAASITAAEVADVDGVVEIAGARAFLESLPSARWAVVTSAPRALAMRRLEAAGLPTPPILVSAEDVRNGKPAPDCFLAAAGALGVPASDCLVWEDAPAGIAAGEAAGASVIVVEATHDGESDPVRLRVRDYRGLTARSEPDGTLRVVESGSPA
ncbi:HAD family hydrolase [Sphingomonas gei]|uniref:HAD family hydrolase n=1 Tax=Sphingomonas gei TaxID=1395960 RepID=A0A4S1X9W7_9SPHN|nr:HAD-IA family hydrolase [Sphingomonas gei]TGX52545.1 HAD family hydrolase [Sphingomonas gei]